MIVHVNVDTRGLQARTLREAKRLAGRTAQALNNTALYGQKLVREEIAAKMTLRSGTKRGSKWLLEQVKVLFASARKGLAYAEVYITQRERLLLAGFEHESTRNPFVGKLRGVPITEHARAGGNIQGSLKPGLTFKQLRMKRVYVVPRAYDDRSQFKGAARTFLLKESANAPDGGVFQRFGPGKGDVHELYEFKKPFRLPRLIHFRDRLAAAMREKFRIEWIIANARDHR